MTGPLLLRNVRLLLPAGGLPGGTSVALAIGDGRVQWLGHERDAAPASSGIRVVDGGGGWLLPGIIDTHFHLLGFAVALVSVDCRPAQVTSIADIQQRIAAVAAVTPPGRWIRAWGYSDFDLAEGRHPTATELDAAAPHHPVRLLHRTGHACVLNSHALRLAGITAETEEPPGGVIERDLVSGGPNGVLFEMGLFLNARNVPPPLDAGDLRAAVRRADGVLSSLGVTAIHDATASNGPSDWDLFAALQRDGDLGVRVLMMVGTEWVADMADRGLGFGAGDDRLRVGPVKIVLDRSTGALHPDRAVLQALTALCVELGFPVALHAVEEETLAEAIATIASVQGRLPAGVLHRIEHASLCPPALMEHLRALPVAVVTQPGFLYDGGPRYLAQVPPAQLPWLYRLRGFADAGIPLALSTDAPVISADPGVTLRAALERRSRDGVQITAREALTLDEAVRAMTGAGAWLGGPALGEPLSVGSAGDAVVLAEHPGAESASWNVRLTVRAGYIAYEA